jgi:hypothetical protein
LNNQGIGLRGTRTPEVLGGEASYPEPPRLSDGTLTFIIFRYNIQMERQPPRRSGGVERARPPRTAVPPQITQPTRPSPVNQMYQ